MLSTKLPEEWDDFPEETARIILVIVGIVFGVMVVGMLALIAALAWGGI